MVGCYVLFSCGGNLQLQVASGIVDFSLTTRMLAKLRLRMSLSIASESLWLAAMWRVWKKVRVFYRDVQRYASTHWLGADARHVAINWLTRHSVLPPLTSFMPIICGQVEILLDGYKIRAKNLFKNNRYCHLCLENGRHMFVIFTDMHVSVEETCA